jgi:pilus assembly protein CpaB
MAKITAKGMMGIALALSLATSGLVYNYLQGASEPTTKETVPVIVAKVDIPSKTKVTAEMVQIQNVPAEYMQPGAVRDGKQVIGVLAREHIIAGEQITSRRLLAEGKAAGLPGIIPPGKRAVTVAVSEVSGVAGLIKPGDHVDVMATFDPGTAGDFIGDILLQNVPVLAVNRDLEATANDPNAKDKKEPIKTSTVTLAIDAPLVHHVAVADDRGKIRLALRPFMGEAGFTLTSPVTVRELMGKPPQSEVKSSAPPSVERQDAAAVKPSQPRRQDGRGVQVIRGAKVETVAL